MTYIFSIHYADKKHLILQFTVWCNVQNLGICWKVFANSSFFLFLLFQKHFEDVPCKVATGSSKGEVTEKKFCFNGRSVFLSFPAVLFENHE